jgi:hypothetical protein
MKIFAYIVSFIVIVLTVNPCIDGLKGNGTQKSEISQSTNTNNHQNEKDHCSPFCTCQCCQSSFFVSAISASSAVTVLEISYNEYSPRFQSLDLFDFYIPPKA